MLATLRIRFARTVALALSIVKTLTPALNKYALPAAEELTPLEYRKWTSTALDVALKAVVLVLAWALQARRDAVVLPRSAPPLTRACSRAAAGGGGDGAERAARRPPVQLARCGIPCGAQGD